MTICSTGRYARIYPAHRYRPTFEIDVTPGSGGQVNVHLVTRGYSCDLLAQAAGGDLRIIDGQRCALQISTPDFCVLRDSECAAGGARESCTAEAQRGHLGALTATVRDAVLAQANGATQFTFNATLNGCVLAVGHNGNVPVDVRGGRVSPCP